MLVMVEVSLQFIEFVNVHGEYSYFVIPNSHLCIVCINKICLVRSCLLTNCLNLMRRLSVWHLYERLAESGYILFNYVSLFPFCSSVSCCWITCLCYPVMSYNCRMHVGCCWCSLNWHNFRAAHNAFSNAPIIFTPRYHYPEECLPCFCMLCFLSL